jgi:chemotaxis protein CheX
MSSTMNHAPRTPIRPESSWKSILECSAVEVFQMMAGANLQQVNPPSEEPTGKHTAMVGLAGALCGMVVLRCDDDAAAKLASFMLGGDAASSQSTIRDALGELCNMVAGNFKSKIATLADHCMLSVPTVISGEDYVMETAEPSEGFRVALSLDGSLVWASIVIHT